MRNVKKTKVMTVEGCARNTVATEILGITRKLTFLGATVNKKADCEKEI